MLTGGYALRQLGTLPPDPPNSPSLPHYNILATRLMAVAWIRPLSLWPKHYASLPPSCINPNTMNNHLAIKKCPLLYAIYSSSFM